MEDLIIKIESDLEVNKICLKEETSKYMQKILKLWIKYDEELLAIIKKEKIKGDK